jgi:cardiolipin synthase
VQEYKDLVTLLSVAALCFHALGILSAIQAIMKARTPQGATAWAIALVSFPYISLPLFWIFGRDRFYGYTVARQSQDDAVHEFRERISQSYASVMPALKTDGSVVRVFQDLAEMRFTAGNQATLCVDGAATFEAIFGAIGAAREYLLIQFFIVKNDELGRLFKTRVIEAARRGVRVYFLYDEIGSHALPKSYIRELTEAGVEIRAFKTTKGAKNRFQLNFRNHRKIVIADGRIGLIGGHNVGDEYLGKDKKFGHWRDTHVRMTGPSVTQIQVSFVEDWHWSSGQVPVLNWIPEPVVSSEKIALVIPTGPADGRDTCCLFFLQAIHAASERLWITSPYFVPDPQIISALQLAAMRGVDVRIMLPSMADHLFVYLASFSYLKEMIPHGVKLFRYQNGFLHQKVLLVDDHLSAVGTANFDNRSFRLNFEITALFEDREFSQSVEAMLIADFQHCRPVTLAEWEDRPFYFRVAVQVARLMAPIL